MPATVLRDLVAALLFALAHYEIEFGQQEHAIVVAEDGRGAVAVFFPRDDLAAAVLLQQGLRLHADILAEPLVAQQAYERRFLDSTPPRRMGQFTHYIIDGIRSGTADLDGDGRVKPTELHASVSAKLAESFNRVRDRQYRQVPVIEMTLVKSEEPIVSGQQNR